MNETVESNIYLWAGAISLTCPGVEAGQLVIEAAAAACHAEPGGHGEQEEEGGHGGHGGDQRLVAALAENWTRITFFSVNIQQATT